VQNIDAIKDLLLRQIGIPSWHYFRSRVFKIKNHEAALILTELKPSWLNFAVFIFKP